MSDQESVEAPKTKRTRKPTKKVLVLRLPEGVALGDGPDDVNVLGFTPNFEEAMGLVAENDGAVFKIFGG